MKSKQIIFQKLNLFVLSLLIGFNFSCSPEDGKNGLDGMDGTDGTDGGTNVVASEWLPIEWEYPNGTDTYGVMDIPVSNIGAFIENGGVAMVYLKDDSYDSVSRVYALPLSMSNVSYYFTFGVYQDFEGIRFYAEGDFSLSYIENSSEYSIRYVLAPAGEAVAIGDKILDYHQTADILGLNQ